MRTESWAIPNSVIFIDVQSVDLLSHSGIKTLRGNKRYCYLELVFSGKGRDCSTDRNLRHLSTPL